MPISKALVKNLIRGAPVLQLTHTGGSNEVSNCNAPLKNWTHFQRKLEEFVMEEMVGVNNSSIGLDSVDDQSTALSPGKIRRRWTAEEKLQVFLHAYQFNCTCLGNYCH